jgi:prepilin-type N-terminal cleavage/methylation domain-containing protein
MPHTARGYSLIELLVAVTVMVILAGAAIPFATASVDRSRTAGAASYLASRLMLARFEAVNRSSYVAVQFVQRSDGYWLRTFVDGNRNGVLARDITRGTDRPITPNLRLDQEFPGISFGICPGVTGIDPGQPFDTSDPIQIGQSTLMSFSPDGSSTAGTLYIRGARANQFAVRVLGATARARVFHFDFQDGKWRTP